MRIKEIRIKNFRCLEDVLVPIEDTTVLLGENNSGKSAFLDALRIALPRGVGRRNSGVSDYDFHLASRSSDPKDSPGIVIEVKFAESAVDEWPPEVEQALTEIIQTDPFVGLDSISLRFVCKYDSTTKAYDSTWKFLNNKGEALTGRGGSGLNLALLLPYVPVFYLSALRDAADEFSPRSQYWGSLLKSIELPDEKRAEIEDSLEQLNDSLLNSDARLGDVATRLSRIAEVMSTAGRDSVAIRAMPFRVWDLMSKSEVIVRGHGGDAWFPLSRQGHGVQSLAVLFLFEAFVYHLLATAFRPQSEPVLALEEPEAHLHPQAARALFDQVDRLPGQKIVSSHSPYFAQHVPFRQLRLFRRKNSGTRVCYLPRFFSIDVADNKDLREFCKKHSDKYRYDCASSTLRVSGDVTAEEYQGLLSCYTLTEERAQYHPKLKRLKQESSCYISDDELSALQDYARRVRGEILFARCWLLCEGPSDLMVIQRFSQMMGVNLDAQGISIIDYQNRGSPRAFVCLARALDFPWLMVCDGDSGGNGHLKEIRKCGLSDSQMRAAVVQLPERDLEHHLVKNGFASDLHQIALNLGANLVSEVGTTDFEEELATWLGARKLQYMQTLCNSLGASGAKADRVTSLFDSLITAAVEASNG